MAALDQCELLPHISIEVQATGIHHTPIFPDCKVEIEGSCYKQSFKLTGTTSIEDLEPSLETEGTISFLDCM